MIHKIYIHIFLNILLVLFPVTIIASDLPRRINSLKELYLETILAKNGKPKAVIISPRNGTNSRATNIVISRLKRLTEIKFTILSDTSNPEDILKKNNVIAIGNQSNNAFIEILYRQWYTLLDIRYPGKGGYVVRSLHNPYGTGYNVILLGGSDDEGIKKAASVFSKLLKPGKTIKIGWLMEIKLGKGIVTPSINEKLPGLGACSWRDSWRFLHNKHNVGYEPATSFGWNPISITGILYYMTGEKHYLDDFRAMAMPRKSRIPLANKISKAFRDPNNPIVKSDHYRSHLVDCVWDLIEENPHFSKEERIFITNKLMQHQYEYDPNHTFFRKNGSRHSMWHMLNIYTGSRYFAKYYPDPIWRKRLANVRNGFRSFINNPTWGERDTLYWVSTSTEPVFEFFMLDGFEEFVKSGTAKTMMKALEILMTGKEKDEYNSYIPISLLHKAAYMTGDTRYIWMARQLGFDFDQFRIGQSFWPADDITINPPNDLINKISVFPLANTYWEEIGKTIPEEKSFQILSYRSGLKDKDDFILLDGFCGLGRNPYHLNTISFLRMFGGKTVLDGYGNDVDIWRDGTVSIDVPRAAVLQNYFDTEDFAYLCTEVPGMQSTNWSRHLLYSKNKALIIIDTITPYEPGEFDFVCTWELGSQIESISKNNCVTKDKNGVCLASADQPVNYVNKKTINETVSARINRGDTVLFANVFSDTINPRIARRIDERSYHILGESSALLGVGEFSIRGISAKADITYLESGLLFLSGATEFMLNGKNIIRSDYPVNLRWNIDDESLVVDVKENSRIDVCCIEQNYHFDIHNGRKIYSNVRIGFSEREAIKKILGNLQLDIKKTNSKERESAIRPVLDKRRSRDVKLRGAITHIVPSLNFPSSGSLWVATEKDERSELFSISYSGKIIHRIPCDNKLLTLWPAATKTQKLNFEVLAGFQDDTLRAISESGEEVWSAKAEIHGEFKIGKRFEAPWFTDPNPPNNKRGIHSILVGDLWGHAKEEIAIGRPCTVEFLDMKGRLIARVPTRWGDNTALATLRGHMKGRLPNLVLAGKKYAGAPVLSGINKEYQNISDRLFDSLPPGYPNMHSWSQRGMSHLMVEDLNGDGIGEIIYALSGHWNELRVYDSYTSKPLWIKYFGPDKKNGEFMRAMVVTDLDNNGSREVYVGTKKGSVCSFDSSGNMFWQRRLPAPITTMKFSKKSGNIVVGLEDGSVYLLNIQGDRKYIRKYEYSVNEIFRLNNTIFAGTANGILSIMNE